MSIKNIVILLAMVGVLGGMWWFISQNQALAPLGPEAGSEDLPYSSVSQTDRYFSEATDLYLIDITYPTAPTPVIQERVDAIVGEEIERFKEESVGLIDDQEASRIRAALRPYELIMEYKPYSYGDFISYEFDIYLDTGGAHPNSFFRTATFDAAGDELLLEDLFIAGTPYLTRLSEEVYPRVLETLRARAGGEVTPDMEDTARLGTAPSPETFQFFYFNDGALHLLFPPYQVAAYAAGSFDVSIPLAELADILKPELNLQ